MIGGLEAGEFGGGDLEPPGELIEVEGSRFGFGFGPTGREGVVIPGTEEFSQETSESHVILPSSRGCRPTHGVSGWGSATLLAGATSYPYSQQVYPDPDGETPAHALHLSAAKVVGVSLRWGAFHVKGKISGMMGFCGRFGGVGGAIDLGRADGHNDELRFCDRSVFAKSLSQ